MMRITRLFENQRRISDLLFAVVLALVSGFTLLGNAIFYRGSSAQTASVSPTFIGNLGLTATIIGVVVVGFWHIPPRELGISWRNVAIGCVALPLAWCAFAIAQVVMGVADASLTFNSNWSSVSGIDRISSDWVGQIFGNAPYEELVFRAFLIPQLYLRLPGRSVLIRLIGAIVLSQVFFAMCHIGTRVFKSHLGGFELGVNLAQVFGSGLAFAWIYMRTLNPFVASAFHALSNYSHPVYFANREYFPNETWLVNLAVAVAFGAAFPRIERRLGIVLE